MFVFLIQSVLFPGNGTAFKLTQKFSVHLNVDVVRLSLCLRLVSLSQRCTTHLNSCWPVMMITPTSPSLTHTHTHSLTLLFGVWVQQHIFSCLTMDNFEKQFMFLADL